MEKKEGKVKKKGRNWGGGGVGGGVWRKPTKSNVNLILILVGFYINI